MKRFFAFIFFMGILGAVGLGIYYGMTILEKEPPFIRLNSDSFILGRNARIDASVKDGGAGLREVSVFIIQDGQKTLVDTKTFPVKRWWKGSATKTATIDVSFSPKRLGLHDGDGWLLIAAEDASLWNELKGNVSTLKKKVTIDITPPFITVISSTHNIKVGGSGLVTFKVNEPVQEAGVVVGTHFFRSFKGAKENTYSTLFTVPFPSDKKKTKVFIAAVDMAGNKQKRGFYYRILPFSPVKDTIHISDSFLMRKMSDFSQYLDIETDDLLKVFLYVNNKLRSQNNKALLSHCQNVSSGPMWKGSFKALPNSARRASFADYRRYIYKGKEIDNAYHMGIDLASIKNAPVPAANSGKVVFAGDIGIYGNTVIIDHGAGLFSSYSHLEEFTVSKGDTVEKGTIIGKTGITGLAGGDHLHFAMAVQGVFVNPIEWFDKKWIYDHIQKNL